MAVKNVHISELDVNSVDTGLSPQIISTIHRPFIDSVSEHLDAVESPNRKATEGLVFIRTTIHTKVGLLERLVEKVSESRGSGNGDSERGVLVVKPTDFRKDGGFKKSFAKKFNKLQPDTIIFDTTDADPERFTNFAECMGTLTAYYNSRNIGLRRHLEGCISVPTHVITLLGQGVKTNDPNRWSYMRYAKNFDYSKGNFTLNNEFVGDMFARLPDNWNDNLKYAFLTIFYYKPQSIDLLNRMLELSSKINDPTELVSNIRDEMLKRVFPGNTKVAENNRVQLFTDLSFLSYIPTYFDNTLFDKSNYKGDTRLLMKKLLNAGIIIHADDGVGYNVHPGWKSFFAFYNCPEMLREV